jgi:hypothetical protein
MKRRRRVPFIVWTTALAFVALAACKIQSLEFVPTINDGGPGDDAEVPIDATFVDSIVPPDAAEATIAEGGRLDANSVEAGCCDCDGDEYRNDKCDAAVWDDAGKSTVIDCDDLAPDINPGAGYTTGPWPDSDHIPRFDWNCDKKAEIQIKDINFTSCSGGCGQKGFQGDPGCSKSANYYVCSAKVGGLLGCDTSFNTATQACR